MCSISNHHHPMCARFVVRHGKDYIAFFQHLMFSRSSGFGSRISGASDAGIENDHASVPSGVVVPLASSRIGASLSPQQRIAGGRIVNFMRRVVSRRDAYRRLLLHEEETAFPVERDPGAFALWQITCLHGSIYKGWLRVCSRTTDSRYCVKDGPALLQAMARCFRSLIPMDKTVRALSSYVASRGRVGQSCEGRDDHFILTRVRMVAQCASTIIELHRRGSSAASHCAPLLLAAVQFILSVREGTAGETIASACGESLNAVVLEIYGSPARSLIRLPPGKKNTMAATPSVLDLLSQFVNSVDGASNGSPSQQEVLISDAIFKVAWSVLEAAQHALKIADSTPNKPRVQFVKDIVHTLCHRLLPSRGSGIKAMVCIAGDDAKILLRRAAAVVWLGRHVAGAPSSVQWMIRLVLMQLLLLSKLASYYVDDDGTVELRGSAFKDVVEEATLWWWDAVILGGTPPSSESSTPAPLTSLSMLPESAKEFSKVIARDVGGLGELFASVWRNVKLVSILCLPPLSADTVQSQSKK